jgi:hypothetical protein
VNDTGEVLRKRYSKAMKRTNTPLYRNRVCQRDDVSGFDCSNIQAYFIEARHRKLANFFACMQQRNLAAYRLARGLGDFLK